MAIYSIYYILVTIRFYIQAAEELYETQKKKKIIIAIIKDEATGFW